MYWLWFTKSVSFGAWEISARVPGELALTGVLWKKPKICQSFEWMVLDPPPFYGQRQKAFCRNFTKGLNNS